MFSFCKPKPKHARLPFSGKFLSNLPNHISHATEKKDVLIGVNVVTEVEQNSLGKFSLFFLEHPMIKLQAKRFELNFL